GSSGRLTNRSAISASSPPLLPSGILAGELLPAALSIPLSGLFLPDVFVSDLFIPGVFVPDLHVPGLLQLPHLQLSGIQLPDGVRLRRLVSASREPERA